MAGRILTTVYGIIQIAILMLMHCPPLKMQLLLNVLLETLWKLYLPFRLEHQIKMAVHQG